MQSGHDDIGRTLEYGHSHDQARKMMPFALGAVALGLVLIVPLDGADRAENWALGWLVVLAALVFVGVVVWRRTQPNEPYIVVSGRGVLFKFVSDRVIPWDEIRAVDSHLVSAPRDFLSTKVVRLEVSQRFFEALARGKMFASVTAHSGDPSHIYLAYELDVPHDELHDAIRRRWRAYSHHASAEDADAGAAAAEAHDATGWQIGDPHAAVAPRRSSAIERPRPFEGLTALMRLLVGGSLGVALGNVVALAAITALITNLMGYWSTEAQVRGRKEAAYWKAWHAEQDAKQREWDADQKRTRERFDLMFRCMDEAFAQGRGGKRSPECE